MPKYLRKPIKKWREGLMCTHPYHVAHNRGFPIKISKEMFDKKHCGKRENGLPCVWLYVDDEAR